MLVALLLASTAPQTAVEAERAFALQAATRGQWAAFRDYSMPDAVMFNPRPVKAHDLAAKAREPRVPIQWWPAESYVACDGSQAVNTGPWARSGGGSGYFTTVWVRQASGGWKWVMDGGDELAKPRRLPELPRQVKAQCGSRPSEIPAVRYADGETGEGGSGDRTLQWRWHVAPDGARTFDAWLWNGRAMVPVIQDRIGASPAR